MRLAVNNLITLTFFKMILRFFDYVQYRVCEFHSSHKGSNPEISGICVVSMMQYFNLFSVYEIFCIVQQKKYHFNKFLLLLPIILLLVINIRRYSKFDYSLLKEKWSEFDGKQKTKKSLSVLAYITLSTVICLWLAIYLGTKKW